MNRNERHAAILRLVHEQPLSTQTELADALRRAPTSTSAAGPTENDSPRSTP